MTLKVYLNQANMYYWTTILKGLDTFIIKFMKIHIFILFHFLMNFLYFLFNIERLFRYILGLRVGANDEYPKILYVENIKSHIKMRVLGNIHLF